MLSTDCIEELRQLRLKKPSVGNELEKAYSEGFQIVQ